MHDFVIGVHQGWNVLVILPHTRHKQLVEIAFRGHSYAVAGNLRYESYQALLRDRQIIDRLDTAITACLDKVTGLERVNHKTHFTIEHPTDFVGWCKTISCQAIKREQLEVFAPNNKSKALRVRPELATAEPPVLAPLSCKLVFSCNILREPDSRRWVIFVWDLYAGEPYDALRGQVTKRTGIAFFDSNHPGVRV